MRRALSRPFFFLSFLLFSFAARADERVVASSPPAFVVGDAWTYEGGFKSLEAAQKGSDPTWLEKNVVLEIRDTGDILFGTGDTRRDLRTREFNRVELHVTGRQTVFYKPFWPTYRYPIRIEDKYNVEFSHDSEHKMGGAIETRREATVHVVGWETVTVPAGTFKALKVEMTGKFSFSSGDWRGGNFQQILWLAPEAKMRHVLSSYKTEWGIGTEASSYESLRSFSVSAR